jgi:hypothetical protein
MSRALAFAKGDLNPHNFLYPSFYFYALFAREGLTALLAVATRAVAAVGAFQREFFLNPTRVFVAGRLLTAFLGRGDGGRDGPAGITRRVAPRRAAGRAAPRRRPFARAEFSLREARRAGHVSHRARVSRVRPALATRRPSLAARGGGDHGGGVLDARLRDLSRDPAGVVGRARRAEHWRRHPAHRRRGGGEWRGVLPAVAVHPRRARHGAPRHPREPADRRRSRGRPPELPGQRRALRQAAPVRYRWLAGRGARAGRPGCGRPQDPWRTIWLLAFPVPFLLFIASTFPASRTSCRSCLS